MLTFSQPAPVLCGAVWFILLLREVDLLVGGCLSAIRSPSVVTIITVGGARNKIRTRTPTSEGGGFSTASAFLTLSVVVWTISSTA